MAICTILRLVHILSGVFWAGASIMFAGFVNPSVKASAPESGKFMQVLARKSGYPRVAEIAGWLTILAGAGLNWSVLLCGLCASFACSASYFYHRLNAISLQNWYDPKEAGTVVERVQVSLGYASVLLIRT